MNKTWNDQQLLLALEKVICNVLRVSGPGINSATRLTAHLGAQSIELFELSCGLQKMIGADVDFRKLFRQGSAGPDNVQPDPTLGQIVNYLKMELETGGATKQISASQ